MAKVFQVTEEYKLNTVIRFISIIANWHAPRRGSKLDKLGKTRDGAKFSTNWDEAGYSV
jgi:hypothetical protein